ncbi:MAG: hypothetical protein K8H88_01775 [Sandaracinaceae bacterium]|nr:hypothetical protein [Sandaracinaceae bacterium]
MTELPLYWSSEQTDAFVRALNEDAGFQKAARKFHGEVVFRCLDSPERKDVEVAYAIDGGRVTHRYRAEDAPSRALRDAPYDKASTFARTTAPFRIWMRLDKGEMNVVQAIASPDYVMDGSKLKIMANIGVFNAMSAVASRLPKRYA